MEPPFEIPRDLNGVAKYFRYFDIDECVSNSLQPDLVNFPQHMQLASYDPT